MNAESNPQPVSPSANHRRKTFRCGLAALGAVALLLAGPAESAPPAKGSVTSDAFTLEKIPGSAVERIILTPRAAERLGIETGRVEERSIVRNQVVGGRIVPPQEQPAPRRPGGGFGGFGKVTTPARDPAGGSMADNGERWVEVTLSRGELDRLRRDQPARVLPLPTRGRSGEVVSALPTGLEPFEDVKRSMLKIYYKVPVRDKELKLYERVRVELRVAGDDDKKRVVVPYSSLYYDEKGEPWVYVSPEPLIYERRRIEVERIIGDIAVVTDGPPVGTSVVTVGAPMLWGAEVVFGY